MKKNGLRFIALCMLFIFEIVLSLKILYEQGFPHSFEDFFAGSLFFNGWLALCFAIALWKEFQKYHNIS